mgnify:CR=1 FL=1
MSERIFSLASLTVLELSPPEMVEVAARAGYSLSLIHIWTLPTIYSV